MKKLTLKGFFEFCKNNIPLIFAVTFTLFFTYGVKLFRIVIGQDGEWFSCWDYSVYNWEIKIGRFWLALLTKLLFPKEWNPYAAFFIAFCMIWVFTISWCYVISIFNKNIGMNNYLIPFALILMTMPIWGDSFLGFCSGELVLMMSLCPYTIYLFYKGFLDDEKGKIAIALILLVLMMATYQALVCMFCCGVFVCFLLLQETSDYEPKVYRNLCIKLFISLIGAVVCYFVINELVLFVLRIEKADYLVQQGYWSPRPVKEVIFNTFQSIRLINRYFKDWRNPFLFPIVAIFFAKVIYTIVKTIPSGRRFLYTLASIGIPLSVLILIIFAGGILYFDRILWALPLAIAFMLFYIMKTNNKKIAITVASISLLLAFFQSQFMAQIFYTEWMRYNDDVHLAYEFEKLINKVQPPERKLPVMFNGYYHSRFLENFLWSRSIACWSFFASNSWDTANSIRPTQFMQTLGINYDRAYVDKIDQALKEAIIAMPPYPNPNCVMNAGDFIVVKLPYMLPWPGE